MKKKEIEKRLMAEKVAQQEIDRLRRELERTRNQAPKTLFVEKVILSSKKSLPTFIWYFIFFFQIKFNLLSYFI